ncbi:hypothetical protein DQ937_21680 [Salmonella enterica subsp. enterica serovar Poona]|nr:hypothetical protein [Salmonella enterica]EBX1769707.1 hypothetical protein [Salmonella enterica subsp. enterica serovar Poona]
MRCLWCLKKGLFLRTQSEWVLWSSLLPGVQATYLQHVTEAQGYADNADEDCEIKQVFPVWAAVYFT